MWDQHFTREVEGVAASGLGASAFVAPFIPCKMGSNRYEDQLFA